MVRFGRAFLHWPRLTDEQNDAGLATLVARALESLSRKQFYQVPYSEFLTGLFLLGKIYNHKGLAQE